MHINRRVILAALLVAGATLPAGLAAQSSPLRISMLIPGQIDDGGFMEAGYNGLVAIRDQLGAETS
jgi:basic membrane protein A